MSKKQSEVAQLREMNETGEGCPQTPLDVVICGMFLTFIGIVVFIVLIGFLVYPYLHF